MNVLQAVILGVIQGLTEFLPVSSTGHMILTSHLMGLPQTEQLGTFEIVVQLGSILAVAAVYSRMLLTDRRVWERVAVAFLPAAVVGLIAYKFIKHYLLGNESVVLWALLAGGVIMIVFELRHRESAAAVDDVRRITLRQAFVVGLFQALAVIPGVSRSGATVIGGLALGLKRRTIVEFSFLLAIPTMAAASALDLLKSGAVLGRADLAVLAAGFITSFLVALAAIGFLLRFIKTRTFLPFGVYRVILALLLLLALY